jgi:hypothetical protein
MRRRTALRGLLAAVAAAALAEPALAHAGNLGGTTAGGAIPLWLVAMTGGGIVGVSFLFATFMTDHRAIRRVNALGVGVPSPAAVRAGLTAVGAVVGLLGLVAVLVSGFFGPAGESQNLAILLVWGGWWAGFTISTYLVGNSWPAVNPWRTLAAPLRDALGDGRRRVPESWGVWPSVVGLLVLVWIEVVSPIASDPRLLAAVVLGYSLVTLAGAARYEDWFERVDPISRAFHTFGRVAPVQWGTDGLELRLPGTALTDGPGGGQSPPSAPTASRAAADGGTETASLATTGHDETPFVIALLWVTTFDGLVTTPEWNAVLGGLGDAGVPGLPVYVLAMGAGYALFYRAFMAASRRSPGYADSFARPAALARRFAPALLPIAAGYHLAHFLGYFLTLSPALTAALATPLAPVADPQVAVLPGWFSTVRLSFVVLGHMVAIWVAHAVAFEVFPGRLRPIRSQYPYAVVMIFYTGVSMWIIARPYVAPTNLGLLP